MSSTTHLCHESEEEVCQLGSTEKGIYTRTFPTLILEAIGCCRFLSFIEKEPGVFVERTSPKIVSVLLGYLSILGIYSVILLGVTLTILAQNYYLRLFRMLDPWEISWILFCATLACLFAFIVGILFYNSSNPIYLGLYCIGLVVALVLLIATLWTSAVFGQKLEGAINDSFSVAINKYGLPDDGWARRTIDDIQTHFQCCGLTNHSDWLFTPFYLTYLAWPDSCCQFRYKQVFCGDTFALLYQYEGCQESFYQHTRRINNTLIAMSSIGLFVIFFGGLLVIMLFNTSKRKKF